ncbi:MAG: hypothetical protein WBV80_19820 [Mycobacterium sp.]
MSCTLRDVLQGGWIILEAVLAHNVLSERPARFPHQVTSATAVTRSTGNVADCVYQGDIEVCTYRRELASAQGVNEGALERLQKFVV